MELQTERIRRFSRVVYALTTILFVVLIVVCVAEIAAGIWVALDLPMTTTMVNGQATDWPVLLKIGQTQVLMPVSWSTNLSWFGTSVSIVNPGVDSLINTILLIVALVAIRRVFRLLRADGSPFRAPVVRALKTAAIVLLVIGAVGGAVPLLAAGVVFVLALVFDYGRALQEEADTTL